MSGAFSAGLQAAVFRALAADPGVAGLVGAAIHDAALEAAPGVAAGDVILLGEETVRPNDTKTSRGAIHDFEVTVQSGRDGFDAAKRIAAAVCACLVDAPLVLATGRVVALRFLRARADRGPAPVKRRIALRFRAVVDEN